MPWKEEKQKVHTYVPLQAGIWGSSWWCLSEWGSRQQHSSINPLPWPLTSQLIKVRGGKEPYVWKQQKDHEWCQKWCLSISSCCFSSVKIIHTATTPTSLAKRLQHDIKQKHNHTFLQNVRSCIILYLSAGVTAPKSAGTFCNCQQTW